MKKIEDFLYEDESYKIRGACFAVWKKFGGVFKEVVISRALGKELKTSGLFIEREEKINIFYQGEKVGIYVPDMIVNESVLIELKCKPYITKIDEKQFWYYLKGTDYKLGFLINFGQEKLEIKRRVYDKKRQKDADKTRIATLKNAETSA